jgi:hypothetical protein
MAAKKSAATTLSEARAELVSLNNKVSDLGVRRGQLLLANDERELDRVEAELASLQKASVRQADKIRLVEEQARAEEADAVAARRKAHVAKFQKKLADADQVADELQATIEKADALFRKVITLREDARVGWWGTSAHENALSVSPDGAALSGIAAKALLTHEIFRAGSRPMLGGSAGEIKQPDFSGGQCPRHEWLGTPDKVEPFGARMRRASKAAIEVMKAKIPEIATALPSAEADVPPATSSPPSPPSGNGGTPSPSGNSTPPAPSGNGDQHTLAALLKRQAQLAEDMTPAGEAAYQEIIKQIAALQP